MLSSEYQLIDNPLSNEEPIVGVYLLNHCLIVYGSSEWVMFNMRAEKQEEKISQLDKKEWPILRK